VNANRELLHRAADAIERAAENATKAPICPEWTRRAVRHIARNCDIDCGHDDTEQHWVGMITVDADGVNHGGWDRYGDAPWFSLMGAHLAAPLASWLRTVAELEGYDGEGTESSNEAVKFARALLNDTPPLPPVVVPQPAGQDENTNGELT
jgi:hypothetical protein